MRVILVHGLGRARLPLRILRGGWGERLTDSSWFRSLPGLSVPYTLVAGTGGSRGQLSPFAAEPNDGKVAVSDTLVGDHDQPVLEPTRHTFIMNRRSMHRLILEKLEGGGAPLPGLKPKLMV